VDWKEVENCLKKADPNLLVFDSNQVLGRVKQRGDLFEAVLRMKQKLPPLAALQAAPGGPAAAPMRGGAAARTTKAVAGKPRRGPLKKVASAKKRG
jgi:hypothetical protein